MQACIPSYIDFFNRGLLENRIKKLHNLFKNCTLCPHECRVMRLEGGRGHCLASDKVYLSSALPHFGEEPSLVGRKGSGTIFFTNCNLRCVFCQNHDISQQGNGTEVTEERLAELMLYLQGIGCLNINLVTPTHYTAQIVASLSIAIAMGLNIPLVWNCGGYESLEVIKLLDGIVDIFMPDAKFGDSENASCLSQAADYFENLKKVLKEMHRQVGDLEMDDNNIAARGLLVRHLVMPEETAGSKKVLGFIAKEISPHTYVNIMDQFRPSYKASEYSPLDRRVTRDEYKSVLQYAGEVGLYRGLSSPG